MTSSFEAGKNCASEDAASCEDGRAKNKTAIPERGKPKGKNKICYIRGLGLALTARSGKVLEQWPLAKTKPKPPAAIRPVTISLNRTRVSPGRTVPWAGQRSLQSTRDGPRGFGPGPLQPTQSNLWYWYYCSRFSIGKTRRRDADDQTQPHQPWAKRPRFGPRTGSAARLEKQHLFYFVL